MRAHSRSSSVWRVRREGVEAIRNMKALRDIVPM